LTIKDIARESGYSIGTVSRCLNNRPGTSPEARKKIMEVVEKYHFKLNTNAQNLKSSGGNEVAILVKGTHNMLFASIVEDLQGTLKQKGYVSNVFYFDEDDNEVDYAAKVCAENKVGGILFLGSYSLYFKERFSEIQVPCVLVTNNAEDLGFELLSSVSTDDAEAASYAVRQLIAFGHKDIGILAGKMTDSEPARNRMRGVKEALDSFGLRIEDMPYEEAYYTPSSGYTAMQHMLRKNPGLTAVFAMSDAMAIGAVRAIFDAGLKVPDDISVMGFDGLDIANYMVPRLTTVRQHKERIASRSVEILIDCMSGRSGAIHEIEPFHLVPGESVRKI